MGLSGRLPQPDRPGLATWTVDDTTARDALTEVAPGIQINAADIGRICRVGTGAPYDYYELVDINPNVWATLADLRKATADTLYEPRLQHNTAATSDPTATDDSDAGYSVRSAWINTSSGEIFRCLDATVGAAVWANTTLTLDELGGLATIDDAPSDGNIYGREDGAWVAMVDTLVDHGTVSSGTETLDYSAGKVHRVEAGGDFTLAHSNWPASGTPAEVEIVAVNWGAHTVTLPGSWNWGDAGAPTFSSAGRDRIILRTDDGGTTIDAMLAGSGF